MPLHNIAMVSSDTFTILNNVCSGSNSKSAPAGSEINLQDISGISCSFRSLTIGKHKNQLRVHISTTSCILSISTYNIYFLSNFFKCFTTNQVFVLYIDISYSLRFCPTRSLTTEEHIPSWILVPGDWLLTHSLPAVRMKSHIVQPKTWPEGQRKR